MNKRKRKTFIKMHDSYEYSEYALLMNKQTAFKGGEKYG